MPLPVSDRPSPLPACRAPSRRLAIKAGIVAGVSLLAACGRRDPWKVGFLAGLSGRVADLGIGGRNGAQLAVEEVNAQGGVDGRLVELLVRDDEQNEANARSRLAELVDAGVAVVIGPMTSAMAVAVVPLADQRGVPLVSPTATTDELSGKRDMFFRVVPDAPTGARQQADYVRSRGARSLVTVTDLKNRAFAQSWTRAAEQRFAAAGGTLAPAVDFEAAPGLSFHQLAQRVLSARAEVIVIAASAADSALLVQQIRHAAPDVLIALSPWAGTEALIGMGGRALEGAIVAQYFERDCTTPRYRAFVKAFRQRFGDAPGYPAVNAFDATRLALEGLRVSADRGVAAALRAIRQYDGLQRQIALDEFGDSRAPMFLTEVKDGAFVALNGS